MGPTAMCLALLSDRRQTLAHQQTPLAVCSVSALLSSVFLSLLSFCPLPAPQSSAEMCWVFLFRVPSTPVPELSASKAFSPFVFLDSTIILTLRIIEVFFFPYLTAGL